MEIGQEKGSKVVGIKCKLIGQMEPGWRDKQGMIGKYTSSYRCDRKYVENYINAGIDVERSYLCQY